MKKDRKAKKIEKNEAGIGKKKWPVWKTIVSVISSVVAICGVTALGVFLAGGFKEKFITPENISFAYEETLYNTENTQIEVCGDFEFKIVSSTLDITEKSVQLSFMKKGEDGALTTLNTSKIVTSDGVFLSDGVLRIPETVQIGEPFKVKVVTRKDFTYNEQKIKNWIRGGISNIRATSEYNLIQPIDIRVAVDVPVYATELEILNSNGIPTQQVITGERFTIRTKYIPEESAYMFSDDKNENIAVENKRTKKTFYTANNANNKITPFYDSKYEMHYVAGEDKVDSLSFLGYTFSKANAQLKQEAENATIENPAIFYINMLTYLVNKAGDIDEGIVKVGSIGKTNMSIGEASVKSFVVNTQNLDILTDKKSRLYIDKNNNVTNSKFLSAKIYSTSGIFLEGLLPNVAITFAQTEGDPSKGENASILVEGGETIEIDGVTYYKPNKEVSDFNNAYWDITAREQGQINFTVVLIINVEGGQKVLFTNSDGPVKYNVTLDIMTKAEKPLNWASQTDINVMLDYSADGNIKPQTVSLSSLVDVPVENMYQNVVFFAYFGVGSKASLKETADKVLGSTGYDYDSTGVYATDLDNLLLFAINGDSITLYNTGEFKIYYGTYKGKTEEGLYDIALMCSGSINVVCEKALYKDSVIASEIDTANFTPIEGGEIAIDKGNEFDFGVKFMVAPESVPVFEDEFKKGFMSIAVYDLIENNVTTNFIVDSSTFTVDDETKQGIVEFRLKINEAVAINNEKGIYLKAFSIIYNNQVKEPIEWAYGLPQETKVCVYSPISKNTTIKMDETYEYGNVVKGIETIKVNQSLLTTGEFKTTINVQAKE